MFRVWACVGACVALVVLGATIQSFGQDGAAGVQQYKDQMVALGNDTKPGTYFPTAQVPSDLDRFRQLMLAVGNAGRRDPHFRENHGATVATDLSGATVTIPKNPNYPDSIEQTFTIFKNQETPPYFKDLVLNDTLNKAAQFQAEYQASINDGGHYGPDSFQGKSMKELADRLTYFGYTGPALEGEGCGGGPTADADPEGLMKGDTHFRTWFNIGADVREMGVGIAHVASGKYWRTCFLAGLGNPGAAERKSERRASPPPRKKNTPPPRKKNPPQQKPAHKTGS